MSHFIHKQYPSYYQTMWTLFQTIPFKKFFVLTNLIYGQTNDENAKKIDFDEWLPISKQKKTSENER